jgi:hypothetical protein
MRLASEDYVGLHNACAQHIQTSRTTSSPPPSQRSTYASLQDGSGSIRNPHSEHNIAEHERLTVIVKSLKANAEVVPKTPDALLKVSREQAELARTIRAATDLPSD